MYAIRSYYDSMLRMRDRERKLIFKIEEALARLCLVYLDRRMLDLYSRRYKRGFV